MDDAAVAVGLAVLTVAVVADLTFSPGYMRRVRRAVAAGDRVSAAGDAERCGRRDVNGGIGGLLVGAMIAAQMARRGRQPPTAGDIDVLVPRTPAERRWFAAVAVTAGTTEEVFYRAFAITVLVAVAPRGQWAAVVLGAGAFALAHLYQGRAGIVATGGLALLFGAPYVLSSSLLPSMVLHVLLDLRVLLLGPGGREPRT